jgi:electron transfer flavoprotein beta subunit
MEVEAQERSMTVKRELEGGWFQRVDLPLPALLTIQSGINKVRYATLMGIKKAKSKPLQRYTPEDLGIEITFMSMVQRVYPPVKSKQTQFIDGSPKEAAAKLAEKLKFEARVL